MAGDTPAPPAAPAPVNVTVRTGRGEFDLLVYGPPVARQAKADILLLSGEGGWARFVDWVAVTLAAEGYRVGGVDARKYLARPQDDPRALAADLRKFGDALAGSSAPAGDGPLILAGFSFGADLLPRAAADRWGGRVHGLLMIAPDEVGSLQYRLLEMIGVQYKDHTFSVADALRGAAGIPVLFVHGEGDSSSAAPRLAEVAGEPKRLSVVPGADHHFSGQERALRDALRGGLEWLLQQRTRPIEAAGATQ